ncbi:DUF3558 domain-containing protein [Nocardia sp. 852002-51101_SCH5132738]|uniref:DUF3558 domain-containing protein n=1 Tax=Nocardia sp. 852002-51101_SCH5132738 TaxID=1834095 RepID=UPI000A5CB2AD|nr:DUF3558 domain-containing protein [Nocardia sp. 852002-51101_SCH5132738]
MQRRVAGVAVAIGAVLAVVTAGCSSTTDGAATSTTSDAAAAVWDPCTGIPDGALTAAQVDPSTKQSGIAGVHQSGWEICAWKGAKYAISVYSTAKHSPGEIANKGGNINQQPVTMAGRQGTQFGEQGADRNCDVVFQTAQGSVQIQVVGRLSDDVPIDPCPTLAKIGNAIVPSIPQ